MSEILNDLMKTINALPENPFANQVVLIPAERVERQVEVIETNESGEEIKTTKTEHYLVALPAFRQIETEARKNGVEYQLSQHAPQKDKDGNLCVFMIKKPDVESGLMRFGRRGYPLMDYPDFS